jgi:hypothetical protein
MNVTFKMAKSMFFDEKAILGPAEKAKRKMLNEFGAYVRTTAKNSIKPAGDNQHAPPGKPPYSHKKRTRYKDWIYYFYDKFADDVIIGGILLPRKDRTKVPGVLERGGQVEYRKREKNRMRRDVRTQQPRPHMQPAFDIAVSRKLPGLIKNSIVKR